MASSFVAIKKQEKKKKERRTIRDFTRKSVPFRYAHRRWNTSVNPSPIDVGRRYIRNIGTVTRAIAVIPLHLTSERVGTNMQPGDDLHLRFSPFGKNADRQCRRDIAGI